MALPSLSVSCGTWDDLYFVYVYLLLLFMITQFSYLKSDFDYLAFKIF